MSDGAEAPGASASSRLGPYEVLGRLGMGGMGEVLRVADPGLDRHVAAKVAFHAGDEVTRRKFVQEARLTGQLQHPNIVPVHALGQDETGHLFFTMKEVQGETLEQRIDREGGLATGSAVGVATWLGAFLKVCDAMAFAHARGVIHCDLKPANVMLGEFGEVLVMDWGLARRLDAPLDPPPGGSHVTDGASSIVGDVEGTPSYMPPEQASGRASALDARSDIYALGAVLYHMLAGQPPYRGGSAIEQIERVLAGPPDPPSAYGPGVPRELEAVTAKAMARDPLDRYTHVRALQHDIQAYLDGRPLAAAHYSSARLIVKWLARHRGLCAGVVAVALAAAGLRAATVWEARRTRDASLAAALTESEQAVDGLPAVAELRRTPGPLGPEPDDLTRVRERALDGRWRAVAALDRALQLAPEDPGVLSRRRRAGEALGRLALVTGDLTLARHAFASLSAFGGTPDEVAALLALVEAERVALATWRRERLLVALDDIARGLARDDRPRDAPLLEDYVLECVRYQDEQTVALLSERLEWLVPKARDPAATWRDEERALAAFACRVLGRVGVASAVPALGRWLDAVSDPELAVEAGIALCHTRDARARPHLLAARDRLGATGVAWRQIGRLFNRVPAAEASPADAPDDLTQAFARGQLRAEQGDLPGAIADFSAVIARDPQDARALVARGMARVRQGDFANGIADYDRAIALRTDSSSAYANRADARLRAGDVEGAIADGDRAIELDPASVFALNNRGIARSRRGDLDGAIADLTRAIELDSRFASAYCNRGQARTAQGDLEGAVADLTRAIELDPRYALAFNNRGNARWRRGDLDGAYADLATAIELDPRSALPYANRGNIRQDRGDLAGAVMDFTRAIELDPSLANPYFNRGNARHRLGDIEAALADFRRAVELRPAMWQAHLNLAQVLGTRGEIELARRHLELARPHVPAASLPILEALERGFGR